MSATTVDTAPIDPTAEDPEPGKRRPPRRLVIALLIVLVGAAAWWFLLRPAPAAEGEIVEGEIVTLDALTTTTGSSTLHHARVGIAVVLTTDGDRNAITERTPLLQDALLNAIAERDADTLRSADGSEQLRADLTAEAQRIWSPEEVARVVLVELLIQ